MHLSRPLERCQYWCHGQVGALYRQHTVTMTRRGSALRQCAPWGGVRKGTIMKPTVAVIGTGFGGLAAAIELKKRGHHEIVIFEKAEDVGGVWRENTYPGAACDVPSPFYS